MTGLTKSADSTYFSRTLSFLEWSAHYLISVSKMCLNKSVLH